MEKCTSLQSIRFQQIHIKPPWVEDSLFIQILTHVYRSKLSLKELSLEFDSVVLDKELQGHLDWKSVTALISELTSLKRVWIEWPVTLQSYAQSFFGEGPLSPFSKEGGLCQFSTRITGAYNFQTYVNIMAESP